MRKLLLTLGLLGFASQCLAANYTVSSFIRPPIASFVVSNNIGVTNLEWVALNQGATPQTKSSGNVTNVTSMGYMWYTSLPPISVAGSLLNGTLVIITNNTPVNPGTNSSGTVTNGLSMVTNSTVNFFQDVAVLPSWPGGPVDDVSKPGAAGVTNNAGTIIVRSFCNTFKVANSAGAGSNTVTLVFSPVFRSVTPPPQGSLQPVVWEVQDGSTFSFTYTNSTQGSATVLDPTVPTVFQYPVSRYQLQGANYLRLRSVTSGTTTNAVWIDTIAFTDWRP